MVSELGMFDGVISPRQFGAEALRRLDEDAGWRPRILPLVALAAGGAAISGISGYLASRNQRREADSASRRGERVAREQGANLAAAGERAAGRIGLATEQAADRIRSGSGAAHTHTELGYRGARADLENAQNTSRNALTAGYNTAQTQLGTNYVRSRGDLYSGYEGARGALTPFIDNQGGRLAALYDRGALDNTFSNFQADPGYQFRLQQGLEALDRKFSATGGRGGGDALKAAIEYSSGLASQEFGNYANRALAQQAQTLGAAGAIDQQQIGLRSQLAGINEREGHGLSGLAETYGARSSGLTVGGAESMSGLVERYGGNMAGLRTREADQRAGVSERAGTALADLTFQGGTAAANAIMSGAGGQAGAVMQSLPGLSASVPYAGAGWQAIGQGASNALGNLAFLYAAGGGGGSAAPMSRGELQGQIYGMGPRYG